ncbi:Hypp4531 [Branchiostoma lanceolatum]|uniref:Hypp4531 protein n=1 Tax=Branchiostoma lanceolatum TaxID=7740 RepID=A0A8K0EW39_BRALA|nr:Hypp4531 [Branchiostoma lanceolatum]
MPSIRKSSRLAGGSRRASDNPPAPTPGNSGTPASADSVTPAADSVTPPADVVPRPPPKPRATLKSLQKQLDDLQKVTSRLLDNTGLPADLIGELPSRVPTTTPSGSGPDTRPVISVSSPVSSPNTHVATQSSGMQPSSTSSVLPIYTASNPTGLRPPFMPPLGLNPQTAGLGSTLTSSILDQDVSPSLPSHGRTPNLHTPPSLAEHLNRAANNLIAQSLAPSTINAYRLAWHHLQKFSSCVYGRDITTPPISETMLGHFLSYLHLEGYAPSSIASMLSAITFVHKLQNLPDPASSFAIHKLMHSIKKHHVPDGRLPITPPILKTLIGALTRICTSEYEQSLYKAMFSFMFYSLARISEVAVTSTSQHTLSLADISSILDVSGKVTSLVVNFKTFKHSNNTAHSSLSILAQPETLDCPVSNLLSYLQLRGGQPGFLFLSRNGNAISCDAFSKILKACAEQSQLDPRKFTSHSFRIGAATTAALQGVSDSTLRRLGRWSSEAFKKYIRV